MLGEADPPSCTCVAAVMAGGRLTVGSIGDSRAYWVDIDAASQLTADDSDAARCRPASPVAVLHIHGDGDPTVRYQGGDLIALAPGALRPPTAYPAAREGMQAWAARDGR